MVVVSVSSVCFLSKKTILWTDLFPDNVSDHWHFDSMWLSWWGLQNHLLLSQPSLYLQMDQHHCFSEQAGASSDPVMQIQCPLPGWHDAHGRRTAFSESVTQQIPRCRQACCPPRSRWEDNCGHTRSLKCWRIWRENLQLLPDHQQRTSLQPICCHLVMPRYLTQLARLRSGPSDGRR